jgi:hypothetical protein
MSVCPALVYVPKLQPPPPLERTVELRREAVPPLLKIPQRGVREVAGAVLRDDDDVAVEELVGVEPQDLARDGCA